MTGYSFFIFILEPEYLENQFTLNNSMWFAIGALLQQGMNHLKSNQSMNHLILIFNFDAEIEGSEIEPKYGPFNFNLIAVIFN